MFKNPSSVFRTRIWHSSPSLTPFRHKSEIPRVVLNVRGPYSMNSEGPNGLPQRVECLMHVNEYFFYRSRSDGRLNGHKRTITECIVADSAFLPCTEVMATIQPWPRGLMHNQNEWKILQGCEDTICCYRCISQQGAMLPDSNEQRHLFKPVSPSMTSLRQLAAAVLS